MAVKLGVMNNKEVQSSNKMILNDIFRTGVVRKRICYFCY